MVSRSVKTGADLTAQESRTHTYTYVHWTASVEYLNSSKILIGNPKITINIEKPNIKCLIDTHIIANTYCVKSGNAEP